jgi:peptidoglycan/xylan/chitin deacetylase (PgdA/CDA1 family)
MTDSLLCLMYHNVVADGEIAAATGAYARLSPSITSYFQEESSFRQHLGWLAENTRVCTLATVREMLLGAHQETAGAVRPRVQITFDDGWKESFDRAGPLLAARGFEALVFVTTDLIGKPMFASRADLQKLPSGYRIGSHARTHGFLNEMPDSQIREELVTSKAVLEEITGREIDTISIPNGAVDDRVTRIAQDAGYRLIYTSNVHANTLRTGPLDIGRIAIRDTTRVANLASALDGAGLSGHSFRRQLLSLPKTILGPKRYRRLRGWFIGERPGQLEMTDLSK